ncbi:MAG: hypothetical protein ACOYJZ_01830 [Acutalibacter sp.]|jgi:hypothetical protein
MKKIIIALTLAAMLSLTFAGCMEEAGKDASQTVSRLESGMEEAGSRLESGMDEAGSRMESDMDETDSRLDSAEDSREEDNSSRNEASPTPQAR